MITSLAIALAVSQPPTAWFGPETVAFPAHVSGNPYDPDENDAWVVFKGPGGLSERRLAYFDAGSWKSVLVAHRTGTYTASLVLNGKTLSAAKPVTLRTTLGDGFVRVGGHWGFQYDSGRLYWPLGHNLGWQSPNNPDLTQFLATMGHNGINWSRIWACPWDGKNPWWPAEGNKVPLGQLWPKAIQRWDSIVQAADKAGVHFQFVLFHHGEFSSTTDSNWKENPWNAANGGFLKNPEDFFTDGHAKKLAKEWVRYAVARWGYSPAVMAWEIFNEVQWTDGIHKIPDEVGKWHDEMAAYIRSIDAVHHLVTTSSSEQKMPVFRSVDYWQPHGYPARVAPMVLGAKSPDKRPLFFGEVGPGQLRGGKATQVLAVRDGIWSGLFALQAGAAEYWSWDLVPMYNLHREYALARQILTESRVLSETNLKQVTLDLDAGLGGDLHMAPGGGWEATRQFEFSLPEDALMGMGKLSSFFQGKGHPEFRLHPITFRFHAPKSGKIVFGVTGNSGSGGNLKVGVNGVPAAERSWAAGATVRGIDRLEAVYPAGEVVVTLDNDGPDWVQLGSIDIAGMAPKAMATAIADRNMLIARLERNVASTVSVRIAGSIVDGRYQGMITDLETGAQHKVALTFRNGRATTRVDVPGADCILWIRR